MKGGSLSTSVPVPNSGDGWWEGLAATGGKRLSLIEAGELGVFISASMRTSRMVLSGAATVPEGEGGTSWLTQSVQLKVSPTYAEPKEGGRLRIGVMMKGDGLVLMAWSLGVW